LRKFKELLTLSIFNSHELLLLGLTHVLLLTKGLFLSEVFKFKPCSFGLK
jgi:hypothetical protein